MFKEVIFIAATYSTQIFAAFFVQWTNLAKLPTPLPVTGSTGYFNFPEIFFMFISLGIIVIWLHDLSKSSLMHKNLKFVCFLISFHIGTACILETIWIIDKFTSYQFIPSNIKLIVKFINGCARTHFILDPGAAVLERGLATLRVANYEKSTSQMQWLALMFIKEIIGIFLSYIFTYASGGPIVFGICWILWLIFTVIVAIILYRVNLRSYKTRIGTLHLTTRYQTVENIRCLKPVLIYSLMAITQNIVALIIVFIMFIHLARADYKTVSDHESLVNLIIAIICAFYPIAFLIYSSRIRKLLKIRFKFRPRSSVSPKTTAPVLSVMGKVLTSKNEQNIYFSQFNTAWK